MIPEIEPGWDILILARRPLTHATMDQLEEALDSLFHRSGLIQKDDPIGA
jgi:RNase P protein component